MVMPYNFSLYGRSFFPCLDLGTTLGLGETTFSGKGNVSVSLLVASAVEGSPADDSALPAAAQSGGATCSVEELVAALVVGIASSSDGPVFLNIRVVQPYTS